MFEIVRNASIAERGTFCKTLPRAGTRAGHFADIFRFDIGTSDISFVATDSQKTPNIERDRERHPTTERHPKTSLGDLLPNRTADFNLWNDPQFWKELLHGLSNYKRKSDLIRDCTS